VRILIPTADYPPIEGGISTVALELGRQCAAMGHEVTVVAPHFPGQEAYDKAEPYEVVRFRGYGMGWLRIVPLFFAVWRRRRNTDLLLAINVAYGGVIAALAGAPFVAFAYGYEFLKYEGRGLMTRLLRWVYRRACVVIAISDYTRDRLVDLGASRVKVTVVYPGARPARPCASETLAEVKHKFVLDTAPVVLTAGRLVPRKGHLTLVRAFPQILERFPEAVLVVVGRGPCMPEVVQEAQSLSIRDKTRFLGAIAHEDLEALYEVCSVFALPTGIGECGQVEGFGLVFAEAHAHGKPVVAGRSGGVPEAVLDGETGLLVEPEDPDALAQAILKILENRLLAERFGENGRRRVEEELNWRTFAQRVLEAVDAAP